MHDKSSPEAFLERLPAERGAIVSSADCSATEIAQAQACGRWHVNEDGMGYVLRSKAWLDRVTDGISRTKAALQLAYRFHHMGDPDVGSNELGDALCDALCELMGDEGFQEWSKEVRPKP